MISLIFLITFYVLGCWFMGGGKGQCGIALDTCRIVCSCGGVEFDVYFSNATLQHYCRRCWSESGDRVGWGDIVTGKKCDNFFGLFSFFSSSRIKKKKINVLRPIQSSGTIYKSMFQDPYNLQAQILQKCYDLNVELLILLIWMSFSITMRMAGQTSIKNGMGFFGPLFG